MPDAYQLDGATVAKLAKMYRDSQRGTPADYSAGQTYGPGPDGQQWFWGKVNDAGANTDHRYKIDRAYVSNTSTTATDAVQMTVASTAPYQMNITATNIAEQLDGTHNVVDGTFVRVWWEYDLAVPTPTVRYLFCQPPKGAVVAKLTGNGSGTGRYTLTLCSGAPSDSGSGDLTMPEGLTTGMAGIGLNLDEDIGNGIYTGTHRLLTPQYIEGVYVGHDSEHPGKPLIMFHGGFARSSPKSLPAGSYGAPDSTTYDLTHDDGGASEIYLTAFGFDGTSGNWWWHTRTRTTDARGMLRTVSAETEHTQATGPC